MLILSHYCDISDFLAHGFLEPSQQQHNMVHVVIDGYNYSLQSLLRFKSNKPDS